MTHPLVEPSGEICTLQTLSLIWASKEKNVLKKLSPVSEYTVLVIEQWNLSVQTILLKILRLTIKLLVQKYNLIVD